MTRSEARADVAAWADKGAIERARVREALRLSGAIADAPAWRTFLDHVLLWLGLVALAAALGFFIAANWQALGRFGKLALVEAALVAALAVAIWRGLDSAWGRAALFVASLVVGTLLALVGQTYQTGADTFELFAVWAVAMLPWALVSRQPALWILWVGIVDVAVWLHAGLSVDWLGLVFGTRGALWLILAVHAAALGAWELAIARGLRWLDVRWAPRLLAVGAGAAATALVIEAIVIRDARGEAAWTATIAYLAVLAGLYGLYRVRRLDLFVLACAVLSAIVVIVTLVVRWGMFDGAGGFLMVGLIIVALAGVGAHWLRQLARGAGT